MSNGSCATLASSELLGPFGELELVEECAVSPRSSTCSFAGGDDVEPSSDDVINCGGARAAGVGGDWTGLL